MIPVNKLVEVFYAMLGWPYASPGVNGPGGVDCSGAFVYAYRQFGERIYHGSNRIVRVYCHDVRRVTHPSQLRVGMAIFKSRGDIDRMKAEYKPGGRYYDPALPYDYYHVGLVVSVSPLKIINATPPRVRIDTDLTRWCCAGYLDAVDYAADEPPAPPGPDPEEEPRLAEVWAERGGTVNLRSRPSRDAVVRVRVPIGAAVEVLEETSSVWWHVMYDKTKGYMMREFLREQDS